VNTTWLLTNAEGRRPAFGTSKSLVADRQLEAPVVPQNGGWLDSAQLYMTTHTKTKL